MQGERGELAKQMEELRARYGLDDLCKTGKVGPAGPAGAGAQKAAGRGRRAERVAGAGCVHEVGLASVELVAT